MCVAVAGLTQKATMSSLSLTSYRNPPAVQRNWRIFLKKRLETLPITARSFEKDYHINGDNFERSYKETISGFKTWEDADHAEILFELYPDIEMAYSLTHSLRMIFAHKCDKEAGRKSIKKWYAKVGEFDNKAFNDIAAAMYDREDEILNYFVNRSTNASAESLNAKIKDFRAQLRGVID